jgi:N-acetylmuramoyl-L-alanine amidase
LTDFGTQLASVILSHNFKSVAEIRSNYNNSRNKVRVLIVPGHEPTFGGTEYADLKERVMVLELAKNLEDHLRANSHYEVFTSRDVSGWTPDFSNYFKNNWSDILEWTKASREEYSRMVAIGSKPQAFSTVIHNNAPKEVATRLYAMTKWANENNIDIAIHIHFNDNPRPNVSKPGEYSGFSIYVPASQYGNSTTTKAITEDIFDRLARYNPVSNLPGEKGGIIDEPELIAVGSNNTADAASLLIEYGYIYESQFQDKEMRSLAIKDLAFQTYLGLEDFF